MTTTYQDIKPASIKPNRNNPPGRTDDVAELAASIEAVGVLEPLLVAPNGTGVTFVLLAGHRRLAAAKIAKLKTVPCVVREDLTEPVAQLETMLVENLQRTDITPIEEAKAYQQLLEFPSYTIKRITTATGRPAATVKKRLALTKLSDRIQTRIQSGQITLADAVALSEFAGDDAALARLEHNVGTYNWRYALENERSRRTRERAAARQLADLRKAGTRIVNMKELAALDEAVAGKEFDTGWVYLGDDEGEQLHQTPDEHKACDGHAAIVEHGLTEYVCTHPAKHPELLEQQDNGESAGDRAARKAREAEEIRLKDELAAAAAVRRAHLGAFVADPSAGVAKQILLDLVLDKCQRGAAFAKTLLGDVLLPKRANDEALTEQLRDRLRTLTVEQLVICLDITDNATEEQALLSPTGWRPNEYGGDWMARSTQAWRNRLVHVYGYEYSQPELDIVPPPAVKDVPLPEADTEQAS